MNFYYSTDGIQVKGPCTASELTGYFASGAIPYTTQVCPEGSQMWQPLSTVIATGSARPAETATATRVVQHQSILSASHAPSAQESTFPVLLIIFSFVGTLLVAMVFLTIHIEGCSRRQSFKSNFERVEAAKAAQAAQAFEEASRLEEEEQRTKLWQNREIISVEEISGGMETQTETQTRIVNRPFVVKSGRKPGFGFVPINEEVEIPKTTYRKTQYRVTYLSENSDVQQTFVFDYNPLLYRN